MRRLGTYLAHLRKKRGKTQWEVACALDYSTSQFISNWERNVSMPPDEALPLLAKCFRTPLKDLVEALAAEKMARISAIPACTASPTLQSVSKPCSRRRIRHAKQSRPPNERYRCRLRHSYPSHSGQLYSVPGDCDETERIGGEEMEMIPLPYLAIGLAFALAARLKGPMPWDVWVTGVVAWPLGLLYLAVIWDEPVLPLKARGNSVPEVVPGMVKVID